MGKQNVLAAEASKLTASEHVVNKFVVTGVSDQLI